MYTPFGVCALFAARTSGFYRRFPGCPQANTTCMKSREVVTSYILVFAAQEIYAACVMIWNVLPPSRPPTVFRFSADQINVFCSLHFFSALAVRRQCIAVLSFWTMRRRSPACHNYYRFVFRLIPFLGYSGERPRLRRACKHPLNSAKPLQQLHRRSETDCPSFRTARILSSSLEAFCSLCLMQLREQIALHVVHHARLAKSPPYCPWLKRFHTLPVRPHAAIRACLRCLLPAGTALHSCRLRSISARRAKGTPKE